MGLSRNSLVEIDNVSGTLTTVSLYCTSAGIEQSGSPQEGTTFGAISEEVVAGLLDHSFKCEGPAHPTMITILDHAIARSKTISTSPEGASGDGQHSGEFIGTSLEITFGVDQLVKYSFGADGNGPATEDTV